MSKKDILFQQFTDKLRKKASKVSKAVIINSILREYFESTLEAARTYPKHFGDDALLAEDDPQGVANQYTEIYKKVLSNRDRDSLEYLYMNLLCDSDSNFQDT